MKALHHTTLIYFWHRSNGATLGPLALHRLLLDDRACMGLERAPPFKLFFEAGLSSYLHLHLSQISFLFLLGL